MSLGPFFSPNPAQTVSLLWILSFWGNGWDGKPASLFAFCSYRAEVSGNLGRLAEEEKEKVSKTLSVLARNWGGEGGVEEPPFALPDQQSRRRLPPVPRDAGRSVSPANPMEWELEIKGCFENVVMFLSLPSV